MSHSERVTAFVLDRVPFKEHDRLYTLLTKERGVVRALARGAMKPMAKVRPHLEGFGVVDIMLIRGRAGFVLASAELLEPIRMQSVESQLLMDSVRKTLAKLLREETGDDTVFSMIKQFANDIRAHAGGSTASLFARELHWYWSLLGELGYNGDVDQCSTCHKPLIEDARFVPLAGAFFCATCSKGQGTAAAPALREFLGKPFSGTFQAAQLAPFSHALAEHFEHRLDLAFPSIFR